MADPGWYPDPEGSGTWRWWDGAAWNAPQPPPPQPRDFSKEPIIFADGPSSARVSRALAIAAGTAATIAALVALGTLALGRPIPGVSLLLLPAIPLLGTGQLWIILLLMARQPALADPTAPWWQRQPRLTTAAMFGGLSPRGRSICQGLFGVAVVVALASVAIGPLGTPERDADGCAFALNDHGDTTCVSEAVYRAAGATGQRFGALVLFGFFVMHCGIALGDVARRRPS